MSLKAKYLFWSLSSLLAVLLFGSFALYSVSEASQANIAASAEYDLAGRAASISDQTVWLRDELRGPQSRTYRDVKFLEPIQVEVREVVRELNSAGKFDTGDGAAETELAQAATGHLERVAASIATDTKDLAATELDHLTRSLRSAAKLAPEAARRHANVSASQHTSRMMWLFFILLLVVLFSSFSHWKQYRLLVVPLLWVRDQMRAAVKAEFREEIASRGDQEFKDIATAFNGLARELADLYHGLEQKVIARSRELVRSERLASVGFLAAGVAHEINNPLSVIAGYAELAMRSIERILSGPADSTNEPDAEATAEAEARAISSALEAQQIIHDEAFRCKEITNRLLSLARGAGDGRQKLQLDDVARQVSVLTKGLRNYQNRNVVLDFKPSEPLEVMANPTEMKQVFMNLTINALEAAPADRGEVRIGGRRQGEWVELFVQDNGKGMSPETLEHVFEPFYTAKRGVGEPGTGLGLTITHAIVESHGGRIRAESQGPGRGSRFTIRLPTGSPALLGVAAAV